MPAQGRAARWRSSARRVGVDEGAVRWGGGYPANVVKKTRSTAAMATNSAKNATHVARPMRQATLLKACMMLQIDKMGLIFCLRIDRMSPI